jgi:acetoacetyl-CoA synthetase
MGASASGELLWEPADDAREKARLGDFMRWLERTRGLTFEDYESLWRWSVDELEDFWRSIWDYCEVQADEPPGAVLGTATMPGAEWFPGTRLNYAEHALRYGEPDDVALVAHSQSRDPIRMTYAELRSEVARVRTGLQRLGVGPGDRVAGYLANTPEAAVGLLATASLGAIWAACPPEFGIQSVLDRIRQIDPKVLLVVDGYRYGAKSVDRVTEVAAIRDAMPGLAHTVAVPYLVADADRVEGAIPWSELRAEEGPLEFQRVPFDHPLWILFSSGTTGLPKPIVHGHGGIVLEQLKMAGLMQDLGPGDRYFFFSTTAWMVWNRVVSSLLTGASIAIFDGDPTYPDVGALFRFVAEAGVTVWGVSATYLTLCREQGLEPSREVDLGRLRQMLGAGSVVPADGYRWVYRHVKPAVHFYSGSGGTDVCTGFVSGTPLSPVNAGEISARMLGVLAEAYNEDGESVIEEVGELVITKPMPSMPVCFWNDPGDVRYHSTYFDRYPGVWRHGDRFLVTTRGSCKILGRSDATLNRGGVRLGTGEFYDVIESLPEVSDSLIVHLEDGAGRRGSLILLVELAGSAELDDDLKSRIAGELRRQRSPRHVPDEIYRVASIPRTLTGKKVEVPVKQVLLGADPSEVASSGSLTNADAMQAIVAIAAARERSTTIEPSSAAAASQSQTQETEEKP